MNSPPSPTDLAPGRSSVCINGVNLETLWHPPVGQSDLTWVLLHEGLGCVDLWRDFPSMLNQHAGDAVFCWSRQGYGRSDAVTLPRPLDYMTQEATQMLASVFSRVPGRQIALLGHSDGASIAALYAGLVPDSRLVGAVLVAPHFFTEQIALDAIAETREAYDSKGLRSRLQKYHRSNVECAFRGWNDAWLDPAFRQWDIRDCLPGVQVPMVLLQGAKDKYGTAAQLKVADELSAGLTHIIMVPGCDHWPHTEEPAALLAATDHLLKMEI